MTVPALWLKIPLPARAILAGVVVTAAGTVPWAILTLANVTLFPVLPWASAVMLLYAWLLGRWLHGAGWPRELSEARRASFRIGRPPGSLWRWSLVAGGFAALSLRALADVARRLSPLPIQDLVPPEELARYPFVTVLFLLLTTAAVAGFAEEAGYRGFLQAPLERRYGPAVAIAIVGLLFVGAHFRFGASDLRPWLLFSPLYLLASVVFGLMAYWTNSTLPGMIWHGLFDAAGLLRYWWLGIPKSVWEVGYDAPFKAECVAAVIFAIPAIWALGRLAREAKSRATPSGFVSG